MWISKKKWENLQQELHWHQCQLEALYGRVREHEDRFHRQEFYIQHLVETYVGGDTNVD